MTTPSSNQRGLLLAAAVGALALGASPAFAQQAAAPQPWEQGRAAGATSTGLAPVAPPPLATPADKLPLDKLKVAKDTLTAQDGVVTSRTGGDKLSYPQLIGEQQLAMKHAVDLHQATLDAQCAEYFSAIRVQIDALLFAVRETKNEFRAALGRVRDRGGDGDCIGRHGRTRSREQRVF